MKFFRLEFARSLLIHETLVYRMSLLDIRYEVLESKIAKSVCNVCETMVGEKVFLPVLKICQRLRFRLPGSGTMQRAVCLWVGWVRRRDQ